MTPPANANHPDSVKSGPIPRAQIRIILIATIFAVALYLTDGPGAATESTHKPALAVAGHVLMPEESAPCPVIPPSDPKECGGGPCVVDIKESAIAKINREPFDRLKEALARPNTTVRIGPKVELDFNGLGNDYFPLQLVRCVTLMSVDSFEPGGAPVVGRPRPAGSNTKQPSGQTNAAVRETPATRRTSRRQRRSQPNVAQRRPRRPVARRRGTTSPTTTANNNTPRPIMGENVGPINDLEVELPTRIGSGRTPKSPGPLFKFGTEHPKTDPDKGDVVTFFELRCDGGFTGDGVRISGIRLIGKSLGHQTSNEIGIQNFACVNFEVSNMEVAGWAEVGIMIVDNDPEFDIPEGCVKLPPTGHPRPLSRAWACPPGKVVTRAAPPGPAGRITRPEQVRIFGNYIHNNQHPSDGPHAAGYGVKVSWGAWAHIYKNVFDQNRHAVAASGDAGGYIASHNLVLKGGGIHGRFYNELTHQFDIHGNKNCGVFSLFSDSLWNCGHAGYEVVYESNAFQYRKENAIKVRGKPRTRGLFVNNIFPHPGFEDDRGDDAISLYSKTNIGFSGNKIDIDTFGDYGVCDFDADGIDDLFLPTGATWWYSSLGEYPWSFMNAKTERLSAVRLGYFDNDLRCDVLTERNGQLLISSGGYGDWQTFGRFDGPLSEVQFGRFDPADTDFRPGATRRTTHAFWRRSDGQWRVASLVGLSQSALPDWKDVASSGTALKNLQFGDFNGDGVTDVLARVGGLWQFSKSAQEGWTVLNNELGESVAQLKIANMDPDDNIDDIFKLERTHKRIGPFDLTTLTWWRSKNGTDSWRKWKEHTFHFQRSSETVSPQFGYVGRFGVAAGGGTLVIGNDRRGLFYSEAENLQQRNPDFASTFSY